MEWISHGDVSSRLFFAKTNQRKLTSYIYTIKNEEGDYMEGFDRVGKVVLHFYQSLMGT